MPPPLPSRTGGTGRVSTHFRSLGVAPRATGAFVANDALPTTRPAPPIAPRCRSCRLVNMILASHPAEPGLDANSDNSVSDSGSLQDLRLAQRRRANIGSGPRA